MSKGNRGARRLTTSELARQDQCNAFITDYAADNPDDVVVVLDFAPPETPCAARRTTTHQPCPDEARYTITTRVGITTLHEIAICEPHLPGVVKTYPCSFENIPPTTRLPVLIIGRARKTP